MQQHQTYFTEQKLLFLHKFVVNIIAIQWSSKLSRLHRAVA